MEQEFIDKYNDVTQKLNRCLTDNIPDDTCPLVIHEKYLRMCAARSKLDALKRRLQEDFDEKTRTFIAVKLAVSELGAHFQIVSDIAQLIATRRLTSTHFKEHLDRMNRNFPEVYFEIPNVFHFALHAFHSSHLCMYNTQCKSPKCTRIHGKIICISYNTVNGCKPHVVCTRQHTSYLDAVFKNSGMSATFDNAVHKFIWRVAELMNITTRMPVSFQFLLYICKAVVLLPEHILAQRVDVSTRLLCKTQC